MKTEDENTDGGAKAMMRSKGYLPAREVAERLGYTKAAIYKWVDAGAVHGVHLGKSRWIEWESVVAYFKQRDPEAAKLAGLI